MISQGNFAEFFSPTKSRLKSFGENFDGDRTTHVTPFLELPFLVLVFRKFQLCTVETLFRLPVCSNLFGFPNRFASFQTFGGGGGSFRLCYLQGNGQGVLQGVAFMGVQVLREKRLISLHGKRVGRAVNMK